MRSYVSGLIVALVVLLVAADGVCATSDEERVSDAESDAAIEGAIKTGAEEQEGTSSESEESSASDSETSNQPEAEPAPPDPLETDEQGPSRNVTLTLSALNLLRGAISGETTSGTEFSYSPAVEVMVEGNIADIFGVGGSVNYYHAKVTDPGGTVDLNALKFALQALWYPVGHFGQGMQLGIQGARQQIFGRGDVNNVAVQGTANATSVAGVVGYKVIIDPGFTFVGQVGGGPRWVKATASGRQGSQQASSTRTELVPKLIFNLNFGWSF